MFLSLIYLTIYYSLRVGIVRILAKERVETTRDILRVKVLQIYPLNMLGCSLLKGSENPDPTLLNSKGFINSNCRTS